MAVGRIAKYFLILAFSLISASLYSQARYNSLRDLESPAKTINFKDSETQVRGLVEQYGLKCVMSIDGRDEKFVSPAITASYGFAFNEIISLSVDFDTAGLFFRRSKSGEEGEKHEDKAAATIGASLGLNFLDIGKDALQARISAGNTIFSGWHHFYAETGLFWQFRPKPGKFNPFISFGGRLYLSHQSKFDNHFGLFVGIGIRRNDY